MRWAWRLVKFIAIDLLWKCSYWGIPEEEFQEMGKRVEDGGQYMKLYHRGLDIDAWDRRLCGTKPGEPSLLVVLVAIALFVSFAVLVRS